MLVQYLLACLIGLGCGMANGVYLLLVLHAASVGQGVWRKLLVLSWPLHVAWPALLVAFGLLPLFARPDGQFLGFVFSYVLPWSGALIWYMRTHPNPLRVDWRRPDRYSGQRPASACSETGAAAIKKETVGSRHVLHYSLVAAAIGLTLYLLLSRRAFLPYYLAALACGVGLALYLLIGLHAIRVARGKRRGFLRGLWPTAIVLYFVIGLAFRLAGIRLGLAGDYAAELGVPFLLGAPLLGMALWYVSKYPSLRSTKPTEHGA